MPRSMARLRRGLSRQGCTGGCRVGETGRPVALQTASQQLLSSSGNPSLFTNSASMFGGIGGALKGLSSKAEEMIEKTKTSVGEMAAEKKAAAAAMLEAQAQKTGSTLFQSKSAAEGAAVEGLVDAKQAAIDGFDQEVSKAEKIVDGTVQETKEAVKSVEETPAPATAGLDPAKLIGSLDIAGGLGHVDKEVEKVVDNALHEVSSTIDNKMKEADHFIDEKREEVVKTVKDEAQKATSSSEGIGGVLGKARGLLNF